MTLKDEGVVKAAGFVHEYQFIGPKPETGAPTLVLLHEGLGCVALWRDFPQKLAAATGFGVFVYSRHGYGGSSPCTLPRPSTYMHEEGELVLPELLEAVGFQKGLLIGHSDGASIAAIYAGSQKDGRVKGIVLMAPHFFHEDEGLKSIARAREAFESGNLREKLKKYHGENVDCAFKGWCDAWLDPSQDYSGWNLESYLPGITVPTLALQGIDDEYGTIKQLDALKAQSSGSVDIIMLEQCGHNPALEQSDRVLDEISRFAKSSF